jgi:hypothetical protein
MEKDDFFFGRIDGGEDELSNDDPKKLSWKWTSDVRKKKKLPCEYVSSSRASLFVRSSMRATKIIEFASLQCSTE